MIYNKSPLVRIMDWHWSCYKPLSEPMLVYLTDTLNTLRLRRNGRQFADDMFKCIFLIENVWIPIEISLKFVPKGSIVNNPALFQIMAWRRPGDKPLSETIMVSSLTHICVTRPHWVNWYMSHSASMNSFLLKIWLCHPSFIINFSTSFCWFKLKLNYSL